LESGCFRQNYSGPGGADARRQSGGHHREVAAQPAGNSAGRSEKEPAEKGGAPAEMEDQLDHSMGAYMHSVALGSAVMGGAWKAIMTDYGGSAEKRGVDFGLLKLNYS